MFPADVIDRVRRVGGEVLRIGLLSSIGLGLCAASPAWADWVLRTPTTAPTPRRVPSAMA